MELIEDLKITKTELYKKEPAFMVRDYNQERELISEYNGRQLLELLQNADDQGATRVQIELCTKTNTLKICNTGNPFSVDGIKSLLIANLSTKTEKKFIGNKGLGFRSIINWANSIQVNSNSFLVKFSEDISKNAFHQLFNEAERYSILSSRALTENAIPIAFLALPEVSNATRSDWATEITITYKDQFLSDIKDQLSTLKPEILLFLNHIHEILIKVDEEASTLSRTVSGSHITIGNDTWKIYELEEELPEKLQDPSKVERERFSIKIALTPNLEKSSDRLYTFFPTKVNIDFPMIIHATFELDSSRNQLVNSNKNIYILERLVDLIVQTAKELTSIAVNWNPVKLLQYTNQNIVLKELGFYKKIDEVVRTIEIFPCVDNTYKKISDVALLGEELPELVKSTNSQSIFNWLLEYDSCAVRYQLFYKKVIGTVELRNTVNEFSRYILSIDSSYEYRIALIATLYKLKPRDTFELLTNDDNIIISQNDDAYTPLTNNSDGIALPSFTKIQFLNRTLYKKLITKLEIKNNEPARELQRILKDITNIQSYEPAQVIEKIISSANKEIKDNPNSARFVVEEMVNSLLKCYEDFKSKPSSSLKSVQLINKVGELCNANQLYIGDGFPSGKLSEDIFGDIYGEAAFLASPSMYGQFVNSKDIDGLEQFFIWLGVNSFVKYERLQIPDNDYKDYVFSVVAKPVGFRNYKLDCQRINFDLLESSDVMFTHEKLIAWVISDKTTYRSLELDNADEFKFSKINEISESYYHPLVKKPSYILFQLIQFGFFNDFLILDDHNLDFLNPFSINFNDEIFTSRNISRRDIEYVLLKLGAKDKFEDLSIKRVNSILKELPQKNPNGKQTQKIYKLALDHYDKHKLPLDMGHQLFAKLGASEGYYPQSKVFYADNIKLPRKLIGSKAILNLPRRQGNSRVLSFFKVKDLNEVNLSIKSHIPSKRLNSDFFAYFEEIKPYLLAYRVANVQKDKAVHASSLNRLKITLCREIVSLVDDKEVALDNNDYLNDGNHFYIRINDYKELTDLKKDPEFCDVFSQVISTIFLVNDNSGNFRTVFKDDRIDVEHVIVQALGMEALNEARALLGISNTFVSFWSAVCTAKKIPLSINFVEVNLADILSALQLHDMDITKLDYSNISSCSSSEIACQIFLALGISVEEFNKTAFYKISLAALHGFKLNAKFESLFPKFRYSLWKALEPLSWDKKGEFLNDLAKFEHRKNWVTRLSVELENTIQIDYEAQVKEFVRRNFDNLQWQECEDFIDIYNRQFNSLPAGTFDSLPLDIKACLYFEGGDQKALDFLNSLKKDENSVNEETSSTKANLPSQSATTEAYTPPDSTNNTKPYKHSSSTDKANKANGDAAEMVVFDSLVAKYGNNNVEHVSKRDDRLGYDIRYSPDSGQSWKYVEVKRYTSDRFFLTQNELVFSRDHMGLYEVFLVTSENEIIILRDVDFDSKEKFLVTANKYLVTFKLTNE